MVQILNLNTYIHEKKRNKNKNKTKQNKTKQNKTKKKHIKHFLLCTSIFQVNATLS